MKKLAAALLATFGVTAYANTLSTGISVGAGEVEYWSFDYLDLFPPNGTITTFTVGATAAFSEDPHLCVFRGTVSAANLVGCDDDGAGAGFNASLTFGTTWPTAGSFIVAISGFQLTVADALAGTNPDGAAFVSTLTVQSPNIFGIGNPLLSNLDQISYREATGVPLPGTVLLLGAGLLGAGLLQRRKAA